MQKVFVNVANIKGRSRVQTLEKYKIFLRLEHWLNKGIDAANVWPPASL